MMLMMSTEVNESMKPLYWDFTTVAVLQSQYKELKKNDRK
jgi:hypothetical protein